MKQYYYTVASLPALSFDEVPALTPEGFLQVCRIEMDEEEYRYVAETTLRLEGEEARARGARPTDPPGVAGRWRVIVREFQQQMALVRAQLLSWEGDRLPKPDATDGSIPDTARQILAESSPLKRELGTLSWLWARAGEMEIGHPFDRETLALYHIKLQIATKRARLLEHEAGNTAFEAQYTKVAQTLMEMTT